MRGEAGRLAKACADCAAQYFRLRQSSSARGVNYFPSLSTNSGSPASQVQERRREATGVQQRSSLSDPEYTPRTVRVRITKGSNSVYVPEGGSHFATPEYPEPSRNSLSDPEPHISKPRMGRKIS
ncbi:hypothetical protein WJX73_001643 [Symbiochloris irregularis]|uniref:Uncharacterized protein n=1 Tax=Symbiochloris irregularis TaxID=706552 RepID=A0AAW1NM11_9CHLO